MCATSVKIGCRDDKSAKKEVNKEGSRVICNPVPTSLQAHRVTYDSRPFLVHLFFADLSSLHPSSFHEMIFTLVHNALSQMCAILSRNSRARYNNYVEGLEK